MLKPTLMVAVCGLLLQTTATAQQLPSQPIRVEQEDAPRLQLTHAVRLGSLDGMHDAFARVMDVAIDGRDRVFVADAQNHRIAVFDPRGVFVADLGRRGQGPGEFESPWRVSIDANDSIFVWDYATGRVSVFGPEFDYARSFSTPPQWGVVNTLTFLPDGHLLLAAYGRGERGALHVLDRSGRRLRTFGPRFRAQDLSGFESSLLGGTVAQTGRSLVYSTKSPYEIWFFDLSGTPVRRCEGREEWTASPASVVRRQDDAVALDWTRYRHSSRVLAVGDGLLLNQVLDPAGENTFIDILTEDCRLLRRTSLDASVTVVNARGDKLLAVRNVEYPEVIVYQRRWVR